MKLRALCVLAILALPACSLLRFGRSSQPPGRPAELVRSVEEVIVRVMESYPEQVHITALGTAPTGGWTNPRLIPHVRPPGSARDPELHEFDFVAEPPAGPATQAVTSLQAVTSFSRPPDMRGVRVFARTNSRIELSR